MRFWDASAIVPLIVTEPSTPLLTFLVKADPEIVVWWATPLEVVSALSRLHREGVLSDTELQAAIRRLNELLARASVVPPSDSIRERAEALLITHALRAADALQLAAALAARATDQPNSTLV